MYTANAKIPTFTWKRQVATGKREKWRENHGHVVTFAVRVSRKRVSETVVGDLCPQQQSFSGLLSLGQLHQVWICKSFDGPCVESINDSDKQSSVTKRS